MRELYQRPGVVRVNTLVHNLKENVMSLGTILLLVLRA